MFKPSCYFDHGATTPLLQEVFEAMVPYLLDYFGNPNSLHQAGLHAKETLESARSMIADSIGAKSREIIFTGSGTEANNMAIFGAARRLRKLGKGSHIITSQIEHASVLKPFKALEKEGFEVTYLPVDAYGRVSVEDLEQTLRPDTIFVSIMHANNVIGTIQPIAEIGRLLKQRRIVFHSDTIQSYGKIPVNVNELQVDLLSMNAHKIGGPKGVAALYVRNGIRLDPILYGGDQERGYRPATQNVAGIVGFAKAVELCMTELEAERIRLTTLRESFIREIREKIPGIRINGHPVEVLPNLINIGIENIEGQGLMLELDRMGYATSSASACSSTDHEPSYVLLATDPNRQRALEGLRITMGRTTNEESIRGLIEALIHAYKHWENTKKVI
jgi:cysteine desulfurase